MAKVYCRIMGRDCDCAIRCEDFPLPENGLCPNCQRGYLTARRMCSYCGAWFVRIYVNDKELTLPTLEDLRQAVTSYQQHITVGYFPEGLPIVSDPDTPPTQHENEGYPPLSDILRSIHWHAVHKTVNHEVFADLAEQGLKALAKEKERNSFGITVMDDVKEPASIEEIEAAIAVFENVPLEDFAEVPHEQEDNPDSRSADGGPDDDGLPPRSSDPTP